MCKFIQGGWGGWPAGNGKKLSSSQAQLARQHAWLLLTFFPFPVGHPPHLPCTCWVASIQNITKKLHTRVFVCVSVSLSDYEAKVRRRERPRRPQQRPCDDEGHENQYWERRRNGISFKFHNMDGGREEEERERRASPNGGRRRRRRWLLKDNR